MTASMAVDTKPVMTWKSSLVTEPLPSSRKVTVLLSAGLQQAAIRLNDQATVRSFIRCDTHHTRELVVMAWGAHEASATGLQCPQSTTSHPTDFIDPGRLYRRRRSTDESAWGDDGRGDPGHTELELEVKAPDSSFQLVRTELVHLICAVVCLDFAPEELFPRRKLSCLELQLCEIPSLLTK